MASDGRGRIYEHSKGKITVYLPADVVKDSAFPFKVGQHVNVEIDGDRLIVGPYKRKKK